MANKPIDVKCVVACTGAEGVPTFFPCVVQCTKDAYDVGGHYELARMRAAENDYDGPMVVFDENDDPAWLFEKLFPAEAEPATTSSPGLPPGYEFTGPAYHRTGEDGCQAQPYDEWVRSALAPPVYGTAGMKRVLTTVTPDSESVTKKLIVHCHEDAAILALSREERLAAILKSGRERASLFPSEIVTALTILAEGLFK